MNDVGPATLGPPTRPTAVVVAVVAAASGATALAAAGADDTVLALVATALTVTAVCGLPWLARVDPFRQLILIAVATAGWDGVRLGAWSLADVLFPVCLLGAFVAWALRRSSLPALPRPVVVAAGLIAVAVVLCLFFPPSPSYLNTRVNPVTGVLAVATTDLPTDDAGGVVRLVMVLLVIPAVVVWMGRTRETAALVAQMLCLGITVSALIAVTDYAGVTHAGLALRGFVDAGGRQSGLTSHPNHLALSAAVAAPFALRAFDSAAVRTGLFGVLAAAVWLSGSRAGLIGLAVGLIAHLALSRVRRLLFLVVPFAVVVVVGSGAIDQTRFADGVADGSDQFRTIAAQQGLSDFGYSPIYGIGAGAVQDAHNIYLQMLAALGLLGGAAFLVVIVAAGLGAWRNRAEPLAVTCAIAITAFLVVGYATNEIASRYVAIPFALVAAVAWYRKRSTPSTPSVAGGVNAEVPGRR